MKMVKHLLLMCCIFCALFVITSCHGGGDEFSAFTLPESFDETKEYNINFWSKNDTNIVQKEIYKKAIENFNKIYPNIHVTMQSYTNYDDIRRDVLRNIATHTYADVCISYPDHVAEYRKGENIVVDLKSLINDPRYGLGGSEIKFDAPTKDQMINKYMDECLVGDAYYGLPFMRSTEALYINKTYLDSMEVSIPEDITWDWIWETSKQAITNKKDDSVLIPFIYKSVDNFVIQYLKQAGAKYIDSEANVMFNNPSARSLLKKVGEMANIGAFRTFTQVSYPGNYLNQNQCIFAIDSTAGATWMGSNCPQKEISDGSVVEIETVVRAIPQIDPTHPYMISQGPSLCLFNSGDNDKTLAAWLFLQYLLSDETQVAYAKTEGYVPVTTKARATNEYQDYLSRSGEDNDTYYSIKIDAAKMLLANDENTFVTPVFNGSAAVRSACTRLVDSTAMDASSGTNIDDAYLDQLYVKIINEKKLDLVAKIVNITD